MTEANNGLWQTGKCLAYEVWVIVLVTVIGSFAILFGLCIRDCIEKSVQAAVRWKLNGHQWDNITKPLTYYWWYAFFYLGLFILIIIIVRFFLIANDAC